MKFLCAIIFIFFANVLAKECSNKLTNSKLFCYYSKIKKDVNSCQCTHVILPSNSDVKTIEEVKEKINGVKILITVYEFNEALVKILKTTKLDGLEINLRKLDSKADIGDFIGTVKSKLGSDLYIAISVPPKTETLAKYYDFKALSKHADTFILQTAFLGASRNVTFHPSRLSGLWDMQNTDSVVDLISGLGAPLSKVVITAPVQAFQFKLQNDEHTAPGSPALEISSITRDELCQKMGSGSNWTLERDQDQAGPYIFRKNQWIAFDDATSMDIKAKYSRVRGLAGLALKDVSQDGGSKCGGSLLEAAYKGLSKQSRAPRGAVLHSLEREILEVPSRPLDTVQVSPYRISRIIDVEGNIHVVRQDTRTEFECARQGYYTHPRSCGRFYRCVKFDQLANDFNVFEFDCPAGLVFDNRYEVCVWPGSLPHRSACSGSSEIAPVPRERYVCPQDPGYYADPENCRWFFACLDHGKAPLSAYEFRCPFGLVFDQSRLLCEWPWLVPQCGSGGAFGVDYGFEHESVDFYGGGGATTSFLSYENYDGLGALGTVALGGLSGTLVQPINRVYSTSVGVDGAGYSGYNAFGNQAFNGYSNAAFGSGYKTSAAAVGVSNLEGLAVGEGHFAEGGIAVGEGHIAGSGLAVGEGHIAGGDLAVRGGHITGSGLAIGEGHFAGNGLAGGFGAKSQQSFVQFNNQPLVNQGFYESSTPASIGKINIVGGGYSAVGATKSGIGISHNGASIDAVTAVPLTPVPTTVSVPVVSSVPIPAIKATSQFESYDGGVIANVPELQYNYGKSKASDIFYQSAEGQGLVGGYVSSTVAPAFAVTPDKSQILLSTFDNNKFLVYQPEFRQEIRPIVTTYQKPIVSVTSGPPAVSFVKHRIETVEPAVVAPVITTYQKPIVAAQPIAVQPASSFTFFNQSSRNNAIVEGYNYFKPAIPYQEEPIITDYDFTGFSTVRPKVNIVEEQVHPAVFSYSTTPRPQVIVKQNIQPIVTNYVGSSTVKPLINVGIDESYLYSKPVVAYESAPIKPAVSSYSFQQHQKSVDNIGYVYDRPKIAFEERPIVASIPKTKIVLQSKPVQPAVSSYSFQQQQKSVDNVGFVYEKPEIVLDERPVVYSTPKPAILPAVGSYSFQQRQKPVDNVGFVYEKPEIVVEERPVVYSTPKPAILPAVQPAVSSYSFQQKQKAVGNVGYVYEKPKIAFEERPIVYSTPKPHIQPLVNSYSFQQQQKAVDNIGYVYDKPNVVFEERPIVYSTPKPVALPPVQPAVSSYSFHQQQKNVDNVGYVYEKPRIAFEERPVIASTPKTAIFLPQKPIQPAIVSSYGVSSTPRPFVESYSVPVKPTVLVEQRPLQPAVSSFSISSISTPKPVEFIEPVQPVQYYEQKPAVVNSYSFSQPSTVRPAVVKQQPLQPVVSSFSIASTPSPAVFVEQQPIVQPKPAVVSSYSFSAPSTVRPSDFVQQKPLQPVVQSYRVSSTPAPVVVEQQPIQYYQQNSFVSSYSFPNYKAEVEQRPLQPVAPAVRISTPRPTVYVEEKPAVVSSYSFSAPTTIRPQVVLEQKPVQPVVSSFSISSQPAVVSKSYQNENLQQQTFVSGGYDYPKPAVAFEENPVLPIQQPSVVSTYNYQNPVAVENTFVQQDYDYPKQQVVFEKRPAVVSSYSFPRTSTVKPPVVVEKTVRPFIEENYNIQKQAEVEFRGYDYPKPSVAFVEKPAVVSSYSFSGKSTVKPPVVVEKTVRPFVAENYNIQKQAAVEFNGYDYPQPSIAFADKPAVVSGYSFSGTSTVKPPVVVEKTIRPIVVEDYNFEKQAGVEFNGYDYSKPRVPFVETYENRQPVYEEPIVPKKAYVTGGGNIKQSVRFEDRREDYLSSTPQPISFDENHFQQYNQAVDTGNSYYINYESARIPTTSPRYVEEYSTQKAFIPTPKPVLFRANTTPRPTFVSTIASAIATKLQPLTEETKIYSYDNSTPKPYIKTSSQAPSTSRPIARYEFSSFDNRYNNYIPSSTTTFAPTTKIDFDAISNSRPISRYSFGSLENEYASSPEVVDFEPIVKTQKYVESYVAPELKFANQKQNYLPVTTSTTFAPEIELSSDRRTYVPEAETISFRPKTIVKVNDFHPLLSAKLGAQCTCASNEVKLRKKPPQYQLSDTEYLNDNSDSVVVENYEYEPQRVAEIPAPEVIIKSTTNPILPAPVQPYVRKTVRIRPLTTSTYIYDEPVTPVVDVFLKSAQVKTPSETATDKEIVDVVRKGLKLIKNAAKEGAEEAIDNHAFDRFGPGGWRSRNEKLQGTIDCQRPGLFRHPNQCNKFYACRWDCTKNRYTLHVFNCPVHLTFDNNLGACNWPSQGPACLENTLLPSD